jgi:hypothetical protein
MRRVLLVFLAGCGRLGFEPLSHQAMDAGVLDASSPFDATVDGSTMTADAWAEDAMSADAWSADACVPETDVELCSSATAQCGSITRADRCGASRTVDCGGCPLAPCELTTHQCVVGCGALRVTDAAWQVSSELSNPSARDALLAASRDGLTVITAQDTAVSCGASELRVSQRASPSSAFSTTTIRGPVSREFHWGDEYSVTLSADGTQFFAWATPDARGLVRGDVARLIAGSSPAVTTNPPELAAVNAFIASNGPSVPSMVLSPDGLSLFFQVGPTPHQRGLTYEARRARTTDPFAAPQPLASFLSGYYGITGVSADRKTLFVAHPYVTFRFYRQTIDSPFEGLPPPVTPPFGPEYDPYYVGKAWRLTPLDPTCTSVLATVSATDCLGEDTAFN